MENPVKLCQHGSVTADASCTEPATHFGVVIDPGGLTRRGSVQDGMAILDLCCKHFMQAGNDGSPVPVARNIQQRETHSV